MKNSPKISIITVCYNSESTIEETILSVITQDYDNWEYLIIDGGSTDGTLQIIDKYREKLAYVVSEPDGGISDAFNKGIRLASGDVIGLINSDDLLAEGALRVVAYNFSSDIDVYRGNMIIEDGKSGKRYLSRPTMKFSKMSRINNVCHPSTFVKSEAYKKLGTYRVGFKYMMDVDLLYRFYQAGAKFEYLNATLAVFRTGGRTDYSWKHKLEEHNQMLMLNDFPKWLQMYKNGCFLIYNLLKNFLDKIVGIDNLRNMKYGSH